MAADHVNQLALEWAERKIPGMQDPRRFLEFVVDGEPLSDRLGRGDVPPLGWFVPEHDELAASSLLPEASAGPARVAIFVCAACGDDECGYVSAIIERQGVEIVWRDFARSWHDLDPEPDESVSGPVWRHETESYASTTELRFDAAEYRKAITSRPETIGVGA